MKIIRNLIIGVFIILMGFLVLDVHVFAEEQTNNGITLTYKVHKEGESYNLLKPTFDGEPFYDKDTNSFKTFVKEYPNINEIIISHIPNAQCNHYSFAGWYYQKGENEFILRRNARFYEDTTFYAKWKPTPRFINYHLNGGINSLGNPKIYNASKEHTLKDPVKEGSTFKGWYSDDEFTNKIKTIKVEDQGTDPVDVYAKWEINSYQVKYHPNGGEGAMANSIHTYDVSQKLSKNTFTKEGHTFIGWSMTQDGEKYFNDEEEVINLTSKNGGTFDLYAKWEINSYKVTFNTHGGNPTSGPREIEYGKNIITPQEPIKIGYTFSGWYSDESYSNSWDFAVDTMPANDLTLHVKWTPNSYQVKYHPNGGNGEMANSSHTYDVSQELSINAFTKVGHTFIGWSTTENGEINYINKEIVKSLTHVDGNTVVLYAKWQINTYIVTFTDYNDEVLKTESVNYGNYATAPTNLSREGYTFEGWDQDFTTVQSNLTVKALYKINEYKITFDSNGGTAVADITLEYNAPITLPDNPAKIGYTFNAWDPVLPDNMPANNLNVTAQWTAIEYTITFDGNGGSTSTKNVAYDSAIGELPTSTRTGYYFLGWYTSTSGGTEVTTSTHPQGEQKYYAQWTAIEYIITFDGNGGSTHTKNVAYDSAIGTLPNSIREGYTFQGWYTIDGTKIESITKPQGEQTYFAQWQINSYTISFNSDGGSNVSPITLAFGSTIPAQAPSKTGYTFTGWSPSLPSTMPANDLEVTAQWKINSYTISFNSDGGSNVSSITLDFGSIISAPTNPTKTGYRFTGWDPILPETMPAEGRTLTAKWDIVTYTIKFHWNNNTVYPYYTNRNTMITDFLTDFWTFLGKPGTLNTFMHGSGKTSGFDGKYNENVYFEQLYNAGNKSINSSTGKFINQPQYNKWVPLFDVMEEYTNIGITAQGVSQSFWESPWTGERRIKPFIQQTNLWPNKQTQTNINKVTGSIPNAYKHKDINYNIKNSTFDLSTPTRYGYVFDGWYDNPSFSGSRITRINYESTGNKNLYAKWSSAKFTKTKYVEKGDYQFSDYIGINKTSSSEYWKVIGLKEIGSNTSLYEVVGSGEGYSNSSCDLYIRIHDNIKNESGGQDIWNRFMLMYNNVQVGDRFSITHPLKTGSIILKTNG